MTDGFDVIEGMSPDALRRLADRMGYHDTVDVTLRRSLSPLALLAKRDSERARLAAESFRPRP